MKVRNEFTLSSLVTRLSLTTIVAGLVYAAIPSEHADYVLQATAANQVAGTPSRSAGGLKTRGLLYMKKPKEFESGRGVW